MKSPRRSSMPWVWSACSWVKSTASSQSTSASRSCSRRLGQLVCAGRLRRHLAEQAKEVLARLPGDLLRRYRARFGQDLGGLDHIGRLIALAAIATGGERRRVGLEQNAVCRQTLRDGAKLVGRLEGHNTGE